MSRFYDALRQASRFHRTVSGGPAEEPWEPFGIDAASIVPPVPAPFPDAEKAEATPSAAAKPAQAHDPWSIASESAPRTASRTAAMEELGIKAEEALLERQVRVIPNVADHVVVEHYRRLRTKLMQQHGIKPFRSLLITSPNPQEGKTVTTLNLALSFAMLPDFRVLVVDGDLRRGTLGKWLRVGDRPGLSNLIEGSASLHDVVLRCEQIPVHFMISGNAATPPAELLHSPQLGNQMALISDRFDLVLVDSPPVNLITDTQLLAGHCDAVLVVARAFATTCKALDRAVQDLSAFRIVGTVLNGGSPVRSYGGYGGYY